MTPRLTILGSGVALGVYIPALLVERGLARRGVDAETLVVESLYTADNRAMLERYRNAYHRDFRAALLGHRMTRDIRPALDANAVDALLARWADEDRRDFVVWSGLWLPILDRYRKDARIDVCRIDAEVSASFRIYQGLCPNAREVWLWHGAEKRLVHEVSVPNSPLAREDRLVVHGGGWGIGTYLERAEEIPNYTLDVIDRDYLVDPTWRAWNDLRCDFPPFGPAGGPFVRGEEHHAMFDLLRGAKAIVSKPGGGTLIDSLASATPVVLLEPYGYAEEANARIWEHLGYGVRFERWRDSGFAPELLEQLHRNLVARERTTIDYAADVVARLDDLAA